MIDDLDRCLTPIAADSRFVFDCRPEVPCFNECCRDLSQVLTPYDVLRLARGLGVPTGEFLRRYTVGGTGPGSGLPVVSLVPGDPVTRICPFLSSRGCRVYPDRPSSCRTYPLVRLMRRARDTGRRSEEFMLLREPHCRGFESGRSWTPARWVESQGLPPFHAENDRLLDLIAFKNRVHPGPLPPSAAAEAATGLYDLDRLRDEPVAAGTVEPDRAWVAAARTDDHALLHLGRERVKQLLASQAAGRTHEGGRPWT